MFNTRKSLTENLKWIFNLYNSESDKGGSGSKEAFWTYHSKSSFENVCDEK